MIWGHTTTRFIVIANSSYNRTAACWHPTNRSRHCPLPPNEAFISERLIGKLIRNTLTENEAFLNLFAAAEARIDRFSAPREMSLLSHYLLVRTDAGAIAGRRRDNFVYLTTALGNLAFPWEFLHPLCSTLSPGEVPLGLR